MKWIVALLLACVLPLAARAGNVDAKLLADHSAIPSGQPFTVGILFDIRNDWHIYWKYPGDAGLATSVRWELPEGFTVSELMWPVPKRFEQAGDIEGFGYDKQVMLLATVTPPPGYSGPADIKAHVRWLECKEVCVPGRADVSTTLQVGATTAVRANSETFTQWLGRLPLESKEVTVTRKGLLYELTIVGAPVESDLQVFVSPPEGIEVRRIVRSGGSAVVEFARLQGADVSGQAEVVLTRGAHAYRVILPMD